MDKVSGNDSYSSSNYSKRIHSTDSLATTTNTCEYIFTSDVCMIKLFLKSSV